MEQLKKVWVYHFWIAVGIVAILPMIGYFVNTRGLANEATARAAKLKNLKEEIEKLKNGETLNEDYARGVREREDKLKVEVNGAWASLYERQVQFMTWPEKVRDVFERALAAKTEVDSSSLLDY